MEKLKIYTLEINGEDTGMDAISFVESPAVEIDFLLFEQLKPIQFQFDSSQYIATGVAILADTPIYRNNKVYGEHYIVFTREVIKKIVERYSKNNLLNSVNLQHRDDQFVDGVVMIESYFVNHERGIVPTEFSNVPDGSWIVSFKVNNRKVWDKMLEKELNGFSIQGWFGYGDEVNMNKELTFDEWIDELLK